MNSQKLQLLFKRELGRGISSRTLAKKIGIAFTSVSNYLYSDTLPSIESLEKIAAYFNVPVGYFFDEEANQEVVIDLPDPDGYETRFSAIENRLALIERLLIQTEEGRRFYDKKPFEKK